MAERAQGACQFVFGVAPLLLARRAWRLFIEYLVRHALTQHGSAHGDDLATGTSNHAPPPHHLVISGRAVVVRRRVWSRGLAARGAQHREHSIVVTAVAGEEGGFKRGRAAEIAAHARRRRRRPTRRWEIAARATNRAAAAATQAAAAAWWRAAKAAAATGRLVDRVVQGSLPRRRRQPQGPSAGFFGGLRAICWRGGRGRRAAARTKPTAAVRERGRVAPLHPKRTRERATSSHTRLGRRGSKAERRKETRPRKDRTHNTTSERTGGHL